MPTTSIAPPPAPLHEPGADIAEGACTPRIVLICDVCQAFVVFCHLNQQTLRDYVGLAEPRWRCRGCATQRGTAAPGGEGGAG